MMSIGLHCRLVGRPSRAATLARFMDYVASKPKVWVATREEIARHWMKVHPGEGALFRRPRASSPALIRPGHERNAEEGPSVRAVADGHLLA